LAQTVLTKLR